jgi:ariadne-1
MCTHEFCWLCSGDWKEHGQNTGGYYNCNKYEVAKKEGKVSNEEKKREDAKHELEKYMFYFERYNNHDKAEKHGRTLKPVIETKI